MSHTFPVVRDGGYTRVGDQGSEEMPSKETYARYAPSRAGAQDPRVDDDSHEQLVALVSKALDSARSARGGDAYDSLLDEKNSLSAVLQYSFSFRKPLSEKELARKKADDPAYVPENVSAAPIPVSFDAATLSKAFGGKVDFTRPQYLLKMYVEEGSHSTAPYPINFTMEGVQGKALHRVFANDGTAATVTFAPAATLASEKCVYELAGIDAKSLYSFGNIDLEAEMEAVLPMPNKPGMVLVQGNRFLGNVIKTNLKDINKSLAKAKKPSVVWMPETEMYMISRSVIKDVVKSFHEQVVSRMKTTDFTAITGVLSRGDRALSAQSRPFADASDAPGLGSKAARDAAHAAMHQVTVNVRMHVIDPTKLRDMTVATATGKKYDGDDSAESE